MPDRSPGPRQILMVMIVSGMVTVALATASVAHLGCMTHSCDGTNIAYGNPEAGSCPGYGWDGGAITATNPDGSTFDPYAGCQGRLIDPDTWESNPLQGNWLPYTPAVNYTVTIPAFQNRVIRRAEVYISTFPNPTEGGDFTLSGGNTAEIFYGFTDAGFSPSFKITNDTCATFFARFLVYAEPTNSVYSTLNQ